MKRFQYYPPLLGYHSVGTQKPDHVPTVSTENFVRQLEHLKKNRFRVIDCHELATMIEREHRIPPKITCITFDDGYEDNYRIAWPILKSFNYSAIIFVTFNEVGQEGFATWEQLMEMQSGNIIIGSHTLNHGYIPSVPVERLHEELVESRNLLENKLQSPIHYLSYPIGGFTAEAQTLAREGGYRLAFTTNRAYARSGLDPYALRRVKMTNKDRSHLILSVKLSGYYDCFRRIKWPE